MHIGQLTNAAPDLTNIDIKKPISHIGFKSNDAAWPDADNVTVDLRLVDSQNADEIVLCRDLPVKELCHISAHSKGMNAASHWLFMVGFDGALNLNDSRYLRISVNASAITAAKTIDIYGVENNNITDKAVQFKKIYIGTGQAEQTFGVDKQVALGFDDDFGTMIDEIQLHFKDAAVGTYSPNEIAFLNLAEDDTENMSTDYIETPVIDLDDVKAFTIVKANPVMAFSAFVINLLDI
jgi:hypothetical protein